MGIEIEKKYRLNESRAEALRERLEICGADFRDEEFETNTLYAGGALNERRSILRVREQNETAIFTYKEVIDTHSSIKTRREEETEVDDGAALHRILTALGFRPSLVYEKRRQTFDFLDCEVVIDELPFGWFAEIEGAIHAIEQAEIQLGLTLEIVEHESYPALTARYGVKSNDTVESRFSDN